ncbi:MAG: type II toxin-antitoxin system HicA family toxin [Oscillospiraceae bacterium]|jgi:predicted RNA binding protein YcfA (HicA-like mRNA interferase family)|nr:type II toxin-antitoxin system HicA family toxin [Oscillospiraceae bacterium]
MTFSQADKMIREDGWQLKTVNGSHHHYIHPVKPGKVTIPMHVGKELSAYVVASIKRQAGLK